MAETILFHNFHPPDDLRIFPIPTAAIRRWDGELLVYDVRHDDLVLRHYSFARRWFAINCVVDLRGRFVAEQGPIAWSFNCDMCTPCFSEGRDVYDVDLWLDVLVAPDGREHVVKDEQAFEEARRSGWLTAAEAQGARAGLAELLGIIQGEGLVAFLERCYPFTSVADAPPALPMLRERGAPPLLRPTARHLHHGRLGPMPDK